MSAAARPMPGSRSICRAPAGSSSIPPTASSAPVISCGSRWRAIRARPSRCTARISVPPMRLSAWMSASMWFRWTRERRPDMEIKVGFEITYTAVQPTPMVIMLSIHPSRYSDIVGTESIVAEPNAPIGFYRDSFGNVCGRLVAPAGGLTLRGSALVRDSGLPDVVVPTAQQLPIDQLPDDVLLYLMASRYCETDKLTDVAWSLFGLTQPGWARVAAICSFVHNHVTFGYQHAHHMKSAHDVYEQGTGVCRDFAHLALTFCRCMGIPARYCTGYMGDIAIPYDPAPMYFSGCFEVFLPGRWYTFAPRHNKPRIGRIVMATGRDAADVALSTSFGRMNLAKFFVVSDEVKT